MTGTEIETLLRYGAIDKARKHLKRLAIPARMKLLQECIPTVNATTGSLKFFKDNFSVEIGALMISEQALDKAVSIYRTAKLYK